MAIPAFDFDGDGYQAENLSVMFWDHEIVTDSDTALVVNVFLGGDEEVDTCTYDGVDMVRFADTGFMDAAQDKRVIGFILTDLPVGIAEIYITPVASVFTLAQGLSTSYTGVRPDRPVEAVSTLNNITKNKKILKEFRTERATGDNLLLIAGVAANTEAQPVAHDDGVLDMFEDQMGFQTSGQVAFYGFQDSVASPGPQTMEVDLAKFERSATMFFELAGTITPLTEPIDVSVIPGNTVVDENVLQARVTGRINNTTKDERQFQIEMWLGGVQQLIYYVDLLSSQTNEYRTDIQSTIQDSSGGGSSQIITLTVLLTEESGGIVSPEFSNIFTLTKASSVDMTIDQNFAIVLSLTTADPGFSYDRDYTVLRLLPGA